MNIAIIPARGGSKRIPRKNIKLFHGKPIIAYSIEAALKSGCFDRVIVSTEDDEIAAIAKHYGADVPFKRPASLADDHAGTISVVAHSIEILLEQSMSIDYVCCLYPTAAFIEPEDLEKSLDLFRKSNVDYLLPVVSFPYPIQRAVYLNDSGLANMFDEKQFNVRSQDLQEAWHDAGKYYWGKTSAWLNHKLFYDLGNTKAFPIDRYKAQDIDTLEDWQHAELMFSIQKNRKSMS